MTGRTPVPEVFRRSTDAATEPQLKLIRKLRDEKELNDDQRTWLDNELGQPMLKKRASAIITRLLALPTQQQAAEATAKQADAAEHAAPHVEPGHYALREPSDDLNPIRFYNIRVGTRGQWKGVTFVDRFVSDDTFPVKGAERRRVLEVIAADPLAAAQLYGAETRRCCICHRKLTRRLSRELGIGPVCGARLRDGFADVVTDTRSRMEAAGLDPDEVLE